MLEEDTGSIPSTHTPALEIQCPLLAALGSACMWYTNNMQANTQNKSFLLCSVTLLVPEVIVGSRKERQTGVM